MKKKGNLIKRFKSYNYNIVLYKWSRCYKNNLKKKKKNYNRLTSLNISKNT